MQRRTLTTDFPQRERENWSGVPDKIEGFILINPQLLEILVCPEDRSRLQIADEALVRRLNEAIGAGWLKNRSGQVVETPLDGALVRQDGQMAYPIIDAIPVMLADQAIPLDQVPGADAADGASA